MNNVILTIGGEEYSTDWWFEDGGVYVDFESVQEQAKELGREVSEVDVLSVLGNYLEEEGLFDKYLNNYKSKQTWEREIR